jgi:hypothetical protein
MIGGPIYPDVPDAAGVPAVRRLTASTVAPEPALASDSIEVIGTAKNQWGIYTKDNAKVLDADSVVSVSYDAEYRIADFPIEEGGFESYDKVALPYQARVVLSKGGTIADRRAFLAALEEVRADLNLYNVVTPERTYLNANIARVSIDRSREQGANLITAEIILQEIRENAAATFTASQPSAADVVSNGPVQAVPADAPTQAIAEAKSAASPTPFVSTGQSVSTIATSAGVPAQKLAAHLAGKAVAVTLFQKATGLFANISMAGLPVVSGVLCRDAVPLINGAYHGFPGDLALIDTEGASDPDFTGLGSRFKLLWAR